MKFRSFILSAATAVMAFAACEEIQTDLGTPEISISESEMNFEAAGGDQDMTVTATRDWRVETDAEWVVVSPESGKASAEPQTVTVSVLENKGLDRTADLVFTIGLKKKYMTVNQAGPEGSAEALVLYSNNFDISKAQNNSGWPYLDSNYDLWDNKKGTGSATVEYGFGGKMSVRTSGKASNDGSGYSHYAGSGSNKIFFGAAPSTFKINKITLDGTKTDFALSFGAQKYLQDGDSNFSFEEFKVYVSNDSQKWVELAAAFPEGADIDGDWNLASANFTVPAGTTQLGLAFVATCGSAYSIDDVLLEVSKKAGQTIDFTSGVELGATTGGTTGGESDATAIYSNNYDKTAAAEGTNGWPFLDSSDAWKNAAGTGAANVTYASKNVTVRNNSNSNGSYSDYSGSGLNNLFFGKENPYFATKNIALNGATGLTLTFGTEKYSQTLGSTFTNSEYHIYLSNDGTKWVEFTDYTFAGTKDGRWNVATANFTVPAGTANLSICMQVDVASSYRLDDMKLVASEGGVAVDFANAVEKDFNAGATDGGNTGTDTPTPPVEGGTLMTIAEVLACEGQLASGTLVEGVVISNADLNNLTSKKGMYVQDETAGLQFYLAENHSFAFGDKVQVDLSGVTVGAYNGAVQVSGLALAKIAKISSGNTVTPKTVTIADFLANKYEGQYVAIEGVQVAATDLAKTWVMDGAHTSINMEDAAGNKFLVFSSKYATYGAQSVAQGSGTIKGISSINNGKMQIIFAQSSDYAGLTGERFDGAVTPDPEPEPDPTPDPNPTPDGDSATIYFNDVANRTFYSTSQQVWEQNGITVTNDKGASTSDVGDYKDPARFYKSSNVTIAANAAFAKIVFNCDDYKTTYPTDLQNSITSGSVTVDGTVVTVVLNSAVTSYSITGLAGQVRVDSITVTFAE